ncbi:Sed5 Vesicle protein Svp26 [Schizosaccharomyces japonicus yFS275]|uniref:Sed5 Vesicle protein Svp26 n=1 Tax=Schizosaccharomyces japonicus (strain yFS275 / FY16936) TaxID=402676 RepID=B6JWK8_SCHJY|nr:Sed5 Vesicle protein Svp26 [Schizosaccharomyces japonicus yFS275]EEB05759.1 Sed5 Vesicle protein Svp26 [Schizosaccharomyces japonicus yFS275]
MGFFTLLSYAGTALGFVSLTISIACALYYLSELVEEHTQFAKRILERMIYIVMAIIVLLVIFDGFPKLLSCFSLFSLFVYKSNLDTYPVFRFTRPKFLLASVLVLLNHWFWYRFFQEHQFNRGNTGNTYDLFSLNNTSRASFSEIASFMGICVWAIPMGFFVSFTAADMDLPTASSPSINGATSFSSPSQSKRHNLVRKIYSSTGDFIHRLLIVLGFDDRNRSSRPSYV